jgi:hypothetical protein
VRPPLATISAPWEVVVNGQAAGTMDTWLQLFSLDGKWYVGALCGLPPAQ